MPEFEIEIAYTHVVSTQVTITARTADEAQRVALARADDGDFDGEKWYDGDGDYTAAVVTAPALVSARTE